MSAAHERAFVPVSRSERAGDPIVRPSLSYWQDAWMRLRKNRVASLGLAILLFYVVMAVAVPMISDTDYRSIDEENIDSPPTAERWFGTDTLGRDMWTRVWAGARVSLSIGILAASINAVIGVIIGGISGYFGGRLDMVIMRLIDVVSGIPYLIVA
ncbi:MAG: ABC transporter permease, partial [Synergistaceae bacterium]|nr:ABC transporter permease [Synergistaceae bacterium]